MIVLSFHVYNLFEKKYAYNGAVVTNSPYHLTYLPGHIAAYQALDINVQHIFCLAPKHETFVCRTTTLYIEHFKENLMQMTIAQHVRA